jgi:hypothetical protein
MPMSLLLTLSEDEPTSLGRKTKALAPIADSFVSRISVQLWVHERREAVHCLVVRESCSP